MLTSWASVTSEREAGEPVVQQQQRRVVGAAVGVAVERLDGRERVRGVLGELEAVDEPRRRLASVALLEHHDEALAGAGHLAERRPRLAGDRLIHHVQQPGCLDIGGDQRGVDMVLDEQRDDVVGVGRHPATQLDERLEERSRPGFAQTVAHEPCLGPRGRAGDRVGDPLSGGDDLRSELLLGDGECLVVASRRRAHHRAGRYP